MTASLTTVLGAAPGSSRFGATRKLLGRSTSRAAAGLLISASLLACGSPSGITAEPGPTSTPPIGHCAKASAEFFDYLGIEFEPMATASRRWSEDIWLMVFTWAPNIDGAILSNPYDEYGALPYATGVWATDAHPRRPRELENKVIVPLNEFAVFYSKVEQTSDSSTSLIAKDLTFEGRAIREAVECTEYPEF